MNIESLTMQQTIDFPLTKNDTLTLSGNVNTSGKYGTGSVSSKLRHVLSSDAYLDVSFLILSLLCNNR